MSAGHHPAAMLCCGSTYDRIGTADGASPGQVELAVSVNVACRDVGTAALDTLARVPDAPFALAWVACEMAWAVEDLTDAGIPEPSVEGLIRRRGRRAATVLDIRGLLGDVVAAATLTAAVERDRRVVAACTEAATRAAICRSVLPAQPVLACRPTPPERGSRSRAA